MEFVNAFVLGRVPLVKTFWIYGVLFRFLFLLPLFFMYFAGYNETITDAQRVPIVLYGYAVFGYAVITYVAIWRSADNYTGPIVWSRLAKVAVGISVALEILSEFVKFL